MHDADILTLLREIRDWVLQQSPQLMDLPAALDKPRAVQAWSTCGHLDADHLRRKQQLG